MSSNIEIIREWIQKEASFLGRTDELFISMFLQACENDVEKTKRRIARYYELRKLYPRLMTNRDFLHEKHHKLFRQKVIYADIVKDNYELPAVLTLKPSRMERDDTMCDALHALIAAIETCLLDSERFRKYGGIAIFDFENLIFSHVLQLTPNLLIQTFKCLFEGVPLRCVGLLFINVGSMLRAALTIASLIVPAEIRNIVVISSGSWESIRDRVSPQCLPIEYGGTNGTLEDNLEPYGAILMRWRDYLLDDEKYGFNNIEQES